MHDLFLEPEVHAARHTLPGHIRQRIGNLISALASNPRPHLSRALATDDLELPKNVEIWRIRVDHWRIVYAINDHERWVWVLGIHRRPPYNYADLSDLARKVSD